jgi:hypothetical protein
MAEPSLEESQTQLQAYLNCLELCQAFSKQTGDPYVKQALGVLIDGLQESLAALAGQLRRAGVAPGVYELDRQGQARIRDVLAMRSLHSQLLAVRRSLVELVAGYAASPPNAQADAAGPDWRASLAAQAQRMLDGWDQHMREMKAHFDKSPPSC